MIQWLSQDPTRMLITFGFDEAERLRHQYPHVARQIIDWRSYHQSNIRPDYSSKIGIDNVDKILEGLLGTNIEVVSMTEDRERLIHEPARDIFRVGQFFGEIKPRKKSSTVKKKKKIV